MKVVLFLKMFIFLLFEFHDFVVILDSHLLLKLHIVLMANSVFLSLWMRWNLGRTEKDGVDNPGVHFKLQIPGIS